MAVKRNGWKAADTWREDLKKENEKLRESARQHKRADRNTIQHAATLEKALQKDPNAFHDYDAVHYYYGENDRIGHNNTKNSPKNKQDAKKILQNAFDEDKKKKRTR